VVEEPFHPLRRWRLAQSPKLTLDAAAAMVGTVRQVWYEWEVLRKLPGKAFMLAIYRVTCGEVRPDHFYELPDLATAELPFDAPPPAPLLDDANAEQEQAAVAEGQLQDLAA
jgi:hypothetical protein